MLTLRTLATAHQAATGPITLWCAPDTRHSFFRALAQRGVVCRQQPEGDIGARMHAASAWQANQPGSLPLLILGTDCPALTAADLQAAAQRLRSGTPAVLQPAQDGGYVLMGLRAPEPGVFAGVHWSTDQVMAQTRTRLQALGLSWWEAPTLWDVDVPADLHRLQALGPLLAPSTALIGKPAPIDSHY